MRHEITKRSAAAADTGCRMSETGIVCAQPFGPSWVKNFEAPDLARKPPAGGTPVMTDLPPQSFRAMPRQARVLPEPGQTAGVAVRGKKPSINACIVLGFDASWSISGKQKVSAREALGESAETGKLSQDQLRKHQFSAQVIAVANALRDERVQEYALAGPGGGIAVLPLQVGNGVEAFFSPDARGYPACEGWALLDTKEKMVAYADRLLDLRRTLGGATHIARTANVGAGLLADCPGNPQQLHVNVLVQDVDNTDGAPQLHVENVAQGAVETNIAGIDFDNRQPVNQRAMEQYYKAVVGRNGRFGWLDSGEAYVKILREQLSPGL